MMKPDESMRIFGPLKVCKQNGRPKIMPPFPTCRAKTGHGIRISCAPSAGRGAGGGA